MKFHNFVWGKRRVHDTEWIAENLVCQKNQLKPRSKYANRPCTVHRWTVDAAWCPCEVFSVLPLFLQTSAGRSVMYAHPDRLRTQCFFSKKFCDCCCVQNGEDPWFCFSDRQNPCSPWQLCAVVECAAPEMHRAKQTLVNKPATPPSESGSKLFEKLDYSTNKSEKVQLMSATFHKVFTQRSGMRDNLHVEGEVWTWKVACHNWLIDWLIDVCRLLWLSPFQLSLQRTTLVCKQSVFFTLPYAEYIHFSGLARSAPTLSLDPPEEQQPFSITYARGIIHSWKSDKQLVNNQKPVYSRNPAVAALTTKKLAHEMYFKQMANRITKKVGTHARAWLAQGSWNVAVPAHKSVTLPPAWMYVILTKRSFSALIQLAPTRAKPFSAVNLARSNKHLQTSVAVTASRDKSMQFEEKVTEWMTRKELLLSKTFHLSQPEVYPSVPTMFRGCPLLCLYRRK